MEVTVGAAACDYIAARGGAIWVRSTRRRCCTGSTTMLRTSTSKPKDSSRFSRLESSLPITVFFLAAAGQPQQLEIELRGAVRRRPVAFWDGCAVKL